MALTITHSYVTPKPEGGGDGPPSGLVGSTEWNADHVISGTGLPIQTAGSNLVFYVSTTGSDSNPGTISEPFATINMGTAAASSYDYQNLYQPTVNVEDGTYTLTDAQPVFLPEIINQGFNEPNFAAIQGNLSHPSNVIVDDPANAGVWYAQGSLSQWEIFGFESRTGDTAFNTIQGANLQVGTNNYNVDTIGDNYGIFNSGGTIICFGEHTILSATLGTVFQGDGSFIGDLILPGSLTTVGAFISMTGGTFEWLPSSVTNPGSWSSSQCDAEFFSAIETNNGVLSDIPGSGIRFIDNTSVLVNTNSGSSSTFTQDNAGVPTSSLVAEGCWAVWKDTSGGGLYVIANDGGTIKKVALT